MDLFKALKTISNTVIAGAILLGFSFEVSASTAMSAGVWFNYTYVDDSDVHEETLGDIGYQALIFYIDHKQDDSPWSFSGEARFGTGSFTNSANNSTGDSSVIHKAYMQYQINDTSTLQIGKSRVPFGWATVNFWGGDMLLGGYGDQMDVGIKYSTQTGPLKIDLAYYHADDWGSSSTDTTDDNGHWGTKQTYRKVQTLVANIDFSLNEDNTIGLSLQKGGLQSLVPSSGVGSVTNAPADNAVDGDHMGVNLHYHGNFGDFYTKFQYIWIERNNLPGSTAGTYSKSDIENERAGLTLGMRNNNWHFYFETTMAKNNSDTIYAFIPGASYDYGPGWIYFEYTNSDGDIGSNGAVGKSDFEAFFVTIDYYF